MPILEAHALEKEYELGEHTVHVLAGVDFVVKEGEYVAITGVSGSGKSTSLRLLGGLDRSSGGEAIPDNIGENLRGLAPEGG